MLMKRCRWMFVVDLEPWSLFFPFQPAANNTFLFTGRMKAENRQDDGGVSSSSEDHAQTSRPHKKKQAAVTSSLGGDQGSSLTREQQLTELLSRASDAIRSERDKVAALEVENDRLRSLLLSFQTNGTAANAGGSSSSSGPQMLMRQRAQELALENFVAIEEIAALRRKVNSLETQLATHVVLSPMKSPRSPYDRRRAHSAQPSNKVVVRHVQSSNNTPQKPSPVKRVTIASTTTMPPSSHHFDPMKSVQHVQETAVSSRQLGGPADEKSVGDTAPAPKNYNDVMIHRLRRALAPPPTKEQLGEVVHAMITEMTRQLRQRGTALVFKRLDHCVYLFADKKKLHLTVDSGRLVVKQGGGHVDLLEYLERNKLCTAMSTSTTGSGKHQQ